MRKLSMWRYGGFDYYTGSGCWPFLKVRALLKVDSLNDIQRILLLILLLNKYIK